MVLHLAHMLSRRGMRRLVWAVPLLLAIRIALRHLYAPFLLSQRPVTSAYRMPPNKSPTHLPDSIHHLPGAGVLRSRLARSADGLGDTRAQEMGQMNQGRMIHADDARGRFRLLTLGP